MTMLRQNRYSIRPALLLGTTLALGWAHPAYAQSSLTPSRPITDDNGVDLGTGTIAARSKDVSIGGLSFASVWGGTADETTFTNVVLDNPFYTVVFIDGKSILFALQNDASYKPELVNGAMFRKNSDSTASYTAPDGARYEFTPMAAGTVGGLQSSIGSGTTVYRIVRAVLANGEVRTWNYRTATVTTTDPCGGRLCRSTTTTYQRVQSVTTNSGLMLKASYASQTPGADFNMLTGVTAINQAVDYCDPNADSCSGLTRTWPTLTVSQSTDSAGVVQRIFSSPGSNFLARVSQAGLVEVNSDSTGTSDFVVTRYPDGKIYQVTSQGMTTSYTYSQTGDQLTVTRTRPNNIVDTYTITTGSNRLTKKVDELGRTTSYEYDSDNRLFKTTLPEGNQVILTYDPLGRVTETRRKAKAGSGLADIVETAGYVTNCTVESLKACMKPVWTVDARGNRTDYAYGADHGEVVTVQLPSPASGQVRPETDYTYSPLFAKVKNASGQLIDAPSPIWKLTGVSRCATAAKCVGTATEQRTTIAYGVGSGGTNLLPTQVTTAAGDGSVSSSVGYAYDASDNVMAADGPLPGSEDTVFYFWDSDRRLVGMISPDPDSSGPMRRQARRYTYGGNQLTRTEIGTTSGTDAAAVAAMTVAQSIEAKFDANEYKISDRVIAGGTTYAVTQYSYDSAGRLECTAVRMNSAVWDSLPASACTLQTSGSAGPDRVTKVTYDAAGEITKTTSAYGTSDAADGAAGTYTNNGQLQTLADAVGNLTTYEYDGFDRLVKTRYPVATVGANSSSTTDYEQLGYDPAGNVTSRRLRDATSIGYGYDALSRLTTKDLPGSEPDVTYGYDLLSRPTSASTPAQTLTFGYDALGRNLTQTGPLGTVSAQYDAAGRRTRLTWPDAFYVTYDYLTTGEMTTIRENSATTGVGVLAKFGYDDLGRRTTLTRGNGTSTSYAFDPASRLGTLAQDLAGTGDDLTLGFAYNLASQIASTTRSNDAYAWKDHYNRNTAYTISGLNQATATGTTAIVYDARGNAKSIGGAGYTYSAENMLLTGPSSAILVYDPLARLYQTSQTGARLLYDGLDMIGEYNASNALQRRYVFGPGSDEPLVWYEGAGTTDRRWLHADERGSVVAVTNGAGAKIATNSYDEYGVPATANSGRFGYTGQAWLPELGMWYYKARVYAPMLGRFMQTDPIGYGDGMNWYNYVGGDPVNSIDPTGSRIDCRTVVTYTYTNPYFPGSSYSDTSQVCSYVFDPSDYGHSDSGGGYRGGSDRGYPAPMPPPQNRDDDKSCERALDLGGPVVAQSLNVSAIPGAGVQYSRGTFQSANGKVSGSFRTIGAGVGFDVGVSATLFQYYGSIQNFVGQSFNISGQIGVGSLSASFSRALDFTGGSASAGTPGKAFSLTASRTRIFGCKYAK